jgi:hypothetical protein
MSKIKDHPTAQLLVEGNDDFHVVHALFKRYNVPVRNHEAPSGGYFSVKDCTGIENLKEQLPVQLKNLQKIGIIVDADSDMNARWQSLQGIFKNCGYDMPILPNTNGTIIHQNDKIIGVWLMPDNNSNGMLEDFIQFLIPNEDKLLNKANKIIAEIEAENKNPYKLIHSSKALIHTWLAWQETPGTPLGKAITAKYLTTENKVLCNHFITWINNVFIP